MKVCRLCGMEIKVDTTENLVFCSSICRNKYEKKDNVRKSGSANEYYKIPEKAVMLQDLIHYKNMNHSEGEMMCALYRLHDNGEYKRNLEKIIYYAKLELEYYENTERRYERD